MLKKHIEKQSCIIKYRNSLVKIAGLFLSVGILLVLISCGSSGLLFDSSKLDSQSEENNDIPEDLEETELEADSIVGGSAENIDIKTSAKITSMSEGDEDVITVHVCGAVNSPGVYQLGANDRVIDALVKAGGFRDDASEDALNLASRLTDGCRVYFPSIDEIQGDGNSYKSDEYITGMDKTDVLDSSNKLVNINTASKDKLMTLKGVGESRAEAIIAYREQNGCFNSIEEIMNVNGIKAGSFEKIKDSITVN